MTTRDLLSGSPNRSTLRVLASVLRSQPLAASALMVAAFVIGLMESAILALVAHIATGMVDGADEVEVSFGPLSTDGRMSTLLVLALVVSLLRLAGGVGVSYLPSRMIADNQAGLRRQLFDAYSRASWTVQAEERDGHLQDLLTSQVVQASNAMLHATTFASSGLTFLTLALAAFALGPLVALVVLLVAVAMFGVLRPLGHRGRRHSTALSAAQIAYAEGISAAVRLAEETYTFGVTDAERGRVEGLIEGARRNLVQTLFLGRLATSLYQGLVILLLVAGLGTLYALDSGQFASLGAVVVILVRASSYGQLAQTAWQLIQQTIPFLERLGVAQRTYRASEPEPGALDFPVGSTLRFENVSFEYRPGVPVLDDVSFSVAATDAIGIVGPSGSGKSTLVQLLLRMRTPTDGRILVDDTPVAEVSLDDWARRVAYVPQESRLLHASVADNIRFSRPLDDASIERAARLAHIHADIMAMPEGYETVIGQRADAVSGGQRQRICLARALAGDPAVLVLDEPTSALDRASETAIQESLTELRGRLTMFIVAHQPRLLEACNRIIEIRSHRAVVDDVVTPSIGVAGDSGATSSDPPG